jgi:hypothetical protein
MTLLVAGDQTSPNRRKTRSLKGEAVPPGTLPGRPNARVCDRHVLDGVSMYDSRSAPRPPSFVGPSDEPTRTIALSHRVPTFSVVPRRARWLNLRARAFGETVIRHRP